MGDKNSGPQFSHLPHRGSLVPGSWNDNPVTRRILRKAGFQLPESSRKGPSDPDASAAAFSSSEP